MHALKPRGVFIASTGQHVGKTTTCLGVVSGMKSIVPNLGYMKPVGQNTVKVEGGLAVDKDVPLFKDQFHLSCEYKDMSPVVVPPGFTRDYLDGKVTSDELLSKVKNSFAKLQSAHDFVICEGTGHTGVGSIFGLNNARVASAVGLDVVLIGLGGLGSSFDELALNKEMLNAYGAKLRGVILNKVKVDKMDMVREYFTKALKPWGVPLIGCIPYEEVLSRPSLLSLKNLLNAEVLSGEKFLNRHFQSIRLAVASTDEARWIEPALNQLVVTHCSRVDVIMSMIASHAQWLFRKNVELNGGLILTGRKRPSETLCAMLNAESIPTLYVEHEDTVQRGLSSYRVMEKIGTFTAKIDRSDSGRLKFAMDHVSKHVDFKLLSE